MLKEARPLIVVLLCCTTFVGCAALAKSISGELKLMLGARDVANFAKPRVWLEELEPLVLEEGENQMIGNTFHQLFLLGANSLAVAPVDYGPEQQAAGFTKEEWDLLTATECWTKAEQMKVPSILSSAVSITLRTAGLPPVPLPGAYVAAVICKLVAPCNRLIAAASAPESFDIMSAVGLTGESQKIITSKEQMYALVVYFSSAEFAALGNFPVDPLVEAEVILPAEGE